MILNSCTYWRWLHGNPISRARMMCACLTSCRFRSCAVKLFHFSLYAMWLVGTNNLPCPLPWVTVIAGFRTVCPFTGFPPKSIHHNKWPLQRWTSFGPMQMKTYKILRIRSIYAFGIFSTHLAGHSWVLHTTVSSLGLSPPQKWSLTIDSSSLRTQVPLLKTVPTWERQYYEPKILYPEIWSNVWLICQWNWLIPCLKVG